jgi:hypothetical protein
LNLPGILQIADAEALVFQQIVEYQALASPPAVYFPKCKSRTSGLCVWYIHTLYASMLHFLVCDGVFWIATSILYCIVNQNYMSLLVCSLYILAMIGLQFANAGTPKKMLNQI